MLPYVPAISLLVVFLIIVIVLQRKFTGEDLAKVFDGKNFLLFSAVILFCILLVVHLFKEQSWTADVLKVIVGVLVGAGAAYAKGEGKGAGQTQTAVGNAIQQAMGDIIGEMKGDIGQLKDSIVHQNQTIQQILSDIEGRDDESSPVIKDRKYIRIESHDPSFIEELEKIQRAGGDWTRVWMDRCLSNPEFQSQISEKLQELRAEGWRIKEMNLDNHGYGLHINFAVEKPYLPAT
jgi:hypothetical protein